MRSPAVVTPEAELTPGADRVRRVHALPPLAASALLAAAVFAGFLSIPVLVSAGMGLAFDGRVMPRVEVAGVDVGFLTAAQAEAQLRERLPDLGAGELTIVVDAVPSTVPLARVGRDHDYAALIQAAMAVGRSGNAWVDGQERLATLILGSQIADVATVDPTRLDRLVVDTATETFVNPTDAAVVTNPDGTYAVTPPADGRRIPPDAIRSAFVAALVGPATAAPVALLTSEPVPFTVTQAQAAEAAAAARAMFATPLSLTDGDDRYAVASEDIQAAIGFGTGRDGEYGVLLDRVALSAVVSTLADGIRRAPTDAAFVFNATGPSAVKPAVRGRTLNVDGTVSAMVAGLERRGQGIEVPAVALSASFVEPTLTSAAAAEILPDLVRLSTWTTWYVPSDGNGYGANISIPAMDLDGVVILPDEDFDFWRDIGPVTFERGYTYGGAIIGGRSTGGVALAGGICSTSTTLFNTALRAGLQMGERMNHHYYIDRYPMGLDATVFATDYFTQTMSFTNDTDGPLIIRSYASPGMVRFDLWGLPTNRVVTFSTPVVWNRTSAIDTVERTSTLPTGTSQRVEYLHNGFEVEVTRTVRDGTTNAVIHTETYYSNYKTVNGVVLVGTG
jgi:vancomycin resistance protein YoaR